MLLGLLEADERMKLSELYIFIIEFVKIVKRDQFVTATAMIYLHKYYKRHSLLSSSLNYTNPPKIIAASCIFLAAKILYVPLSLKTIAQTFFSIEKKENAQLRYTNYLSIEREYYFRDMFEEAELQVLDALGFEFECELPYKYIREFCYGGSYLVITARDSISELAVKFCNDSFKIPLCLYFHPKVIAAACILMAALWRKNKGIDCGLPLVIKGHPWFKWVDSAIE